MDVENGQLHLTFCVVEPDPLAIFFLVKGYGEMLVKAGAVLQQPP